MDAEVEVSTEDAVVTDEDVAAARAEAAMRREVSEASVEASEVVEDGPRSRREPTVAARPFASRGVGIVSLLKDSNDGAVLPHF